MPTSADAVQALGLARTRRRDRGEDRRAGDEDAGHRRGDVVLADRDEQERHDDLDERDERRASRAAGARAPNAPRLQRDRREDERAERGAREDDERVGPRSSSAISMNMYDAPHSAASSAHQDPGASGHRSRLGAPAARGQSDPLWVRSALAAAALLGHAPDEEREPVQRGRLAARVVGERDGALARAHRVAQERVAAAAPGGRARSRPSELVLELARVEQLVVGERRGRVAVAGDRAAVADDQRSFASGREPARSTTKRSCEGVPQPASRAAASASDAGERRVRGAAVAPRVRVQRPSRASANRFFRPIGAFRRTRDCLWGGTLARRGAR